MSRQSRHLLGKHARIPSSNLPKSSSTYWSVGTYVKELSDCFPKKLVKALKVERLILEKDSAGVEQSVWKEVLLEPLITKVKGLAAVRNQVGAHFNELGSLCTDAEVESVHLNLRARSFRSEPGFMLTDRQKSILDFIQSEQREKGVTPSTREIQKHFRFASQTSVMQYLDALERKGFLDRHARKARALITPAMKVRITDIPIYGQIPAGMATLTEQAIEGHVSLDMRSANISKSGRTFALRVRGDSMIDAHIVDGDIVILEDRKDVQSGDIVAALIDGETTLKRYVTEHGRPYLKAENPRYPNLTPARELRIQGVMVSLVRKQPAGQRRKRG